MREGYENVYEKLYVFLIESIDFLKINLDIKQIQCVGDTRVKYDDLSQCIVKEGGVNWHQLKIPRDLIRLRSYFEIVDALQKHSIILKRNDDSAWAFCNGTQFSIELFPMDFLKKYLIRYRKIEFDLETFSTLFEDFLNFIDPERQDFASIVVPFDNFIISTNVAYIDSDLRIRVLDKNELIDIINHNPILHHYYGAGDAFWFVCVFEIPVPFKWSWGRDNETSTKNFYLNTRHPDIYTFFDRKINQEIVILRTVYNYAVTAPTFFVDYRGWMSESLAWTVRYSPWRRRPFIPLNKPFDISKYCEYRNKMHLIDTKSRQRLFVAMRKFAYSLDKVYPGDRLVDTVSGLEGLVIGDSKQEVSHRFAERVALLLETDPDERLKLLDSMKKAYGLRSSVAHGTALLDDFDFFFLPSEKSKWVKGKTKANYGESEQLLEIAHLKLQEAILLCLDKQSTDFSWDEIIMGKTSKP